MNTMKSIKSKGVLIAAGLVAALAFLIIAVSQNEAPQTIAPDDAPSYNNRLVDSYEETQPAPEAQPAPEIEHTYSLREILQIYIDRGEAPKGMLENTPTLLSERTLTVAQSDNLWELARNAYGRGIYYTIIYEANRDVIGDNPNLINPGQHLELPYLIAGRPYFFERQDLPDIQASIVLPSNFTMTTGNTSNRGIIFEDGRNHIVFSQEDSQVEFMFFLIDERLTANNIFAYALMQRGVLQSELPTITFPSQADAVSRVSTKTAYFDFITREDGAYFYNLAFMTPVGRSLLVGVLRCPAIISEDWQPFMLEVMRSLPEPAASQIGIGPVNNVSHVGEWEIKVWGRQTVATGLGGMPWQHLFRGEPSGPPLDSTLLTVALPTTRETRSFYQNWPSTVRTMTEILHEMAGQDTVGFVGYDQIYTPNGNVYVFEFELDCALVTMAWRFKQSYYLFAMGVDLGDMYEMPEITIEAARNFVDHTALPFMGWQNTVWRGVPDENVPAWDYPVHNPFWPLWEYFYREGGVFNPIPPEEPITLGEPFDWGDRILLPADQAIPPRDVFLERYNQAATELGTPTINRRDLEEISFWRGDVLEVIEGSFGYEIRNHRREFVGSIMFEPNTVRLIASGDSERERLLFYAATAGAVTGLSAEVSLAAMTDMVYNAQFRVRENGFEYYENLVVLGGVPVLFEDGGFPDSARQNTIAQVFINWDHARERVEQEAAG